MYGRRVARGYLFEFDFEVVEYSLNILIDFDSPYFLVFALSLVPSRVIITRDHS